jgi:hypothetical protein
VLSKWLRLEMAAALTGGHMQIVVDKGMEIINPCRQRSRMGAQARRYPIL